jgi:hypothetical protein
MAFGMKTLHFLRWLLIAFLPSEHEPKTHFQDFSSNSASVSLLLDVASGESPMSNTGK